MIACLVVSLLSCLLAWVGWWRACSIDPLLVFVFFVVVVVVDVAVVAVSVACFCGVDVFGCSRTVHSREALVASASALGIGLVPRLGASDLGPRSRLGLALQRLVDLATDGLRTNLDGWVEIIIDAAQVDQRDAILVA